MISDLEPNLVLDDDWWVNLNYDVNYVRVVIRWVDNDKLSNNVLIFVWL